jgi:hypothetical protein
MKTNKTLLSAIAVTTLLLFATSCSKEFYTKVNVNTNQPTVVPPSTLLPGVEVSIAYAQGGDASRYAQLFVQQGFGAAREATSFYNYELSGTNLPEDLWDNMYTSDMMNDYTLLNMATTNGYNEYAGIADILMAYSLQVTCDFWGSIPYSQAFQGSGDIAPKYDADVTIYSDIISLCNTGIADLRKPTGVLVPSTDDVMYGGNYKKWIAFAFALEARVYMHQCKSNSATNCTSALNAADSAIAEGFTIAQVQFPGAPNSCPVFQYNSDWGDITYVNSGGVNPTLYDTMLIYSDPRIGVYFDSTGSANATTPIVGMNTVSSYYSMATSPVEFITAEELYFIQAEATVRSQGAAGIPAAQTDYLMAIQANFAKFGLGNSAYTAYTLTSQGTLPSDVTGALYQIGKQEWMTYFLNPEAWVSWRRTGAPALQAPTTASSTMIPRRMVLPNSETTENTNAPQNETLWTPVIFWDN